MLSIRIFVKFALFKKHTNMNNILSRAEFLLLALFAVSVGLELVGNKLSVLYGISLAGLALVFFLFAQFPVSNEKANEEENSNFTSLLGLVILPKILWIGTALTTVGIMFHLQNFKGSFNLLVIGASTIAICTVILVLLRIMKIRNLQGVIPILYRSYPALLAAAYFIIA
jgi:hypothetical protein